MTATGTRPRSGSKRKAYDGPTAEEQLVADLIGLMERGTTPWRREWQGQQGRHRNLLTGEPYRGSNPLLLELGNLIRGTTLPLWLGAAQARAKGWFPKKGSKAVRIVRPQQNAREDEKPDGSKELRAWVSYKVVPVFNVGDLTSNEPEKLAALEAAIALATAVPEPSSQLERVLAAEAALAGWEVPTQFGGALACYSPTVDRISMPAREAFCDPEAFCATWAHEQAHSTGHKSRLSRDMTGSHGSRKYAREELVAELAAVLVCQRLEVGTRMENHAAYLSHWAELLREGPRVLLQVLGDARKAADLLVPEAPAPDETEPAAVALAPETAEPLVAAA